MLVKKLINKNESGIILIHRLFYFIYRIVIGETFYHN